MLYRGKTRPTSRVGRSRSRTNHHPARNRHRLSLKRLLLGMLLTVGLLYIAFIGLSIRKLHTHPNGSGTAKQSWKATSDKRVLSQQQQQAFQQPTIQLDFSQHQTDAEAALQRDPVAFRSQNVLTAYVEPPLKDTIPGTGSRGDVSKNKPDPGVAPQFHIPLPLRTHTPDDLQIYHYPQVQTCNDLPARFPVDRGLEFDSVTGDPVVWNVGDTPLPPEFPQQEAPYCPVELDPFLPWIHDVFPSPDGSSIQFIAQNKRRCRTGTKFTNEVNRLVPQATLMQSVSVATLSEEEAQKLAPSLWKESGKSKHQFPRYRLAPYNESTVPETRFICRFHLATASDQKTIVLGETLSQFPFNYEMVSYRKMRRSLVSPSGKDTRLFWTSNLRFSCPVPTNSQLPMAIVEGATLLSDATPTLFVDIVPIRTSLRYEEHYLRPDQIGPRDKWQVPGFDPVTRWGPHQVLPRVEASGRWANIPICLPPARSSDTMDRAPLALPSEATKKEKPHFLSACLWASTEFKTRGRVKGSDASSDTLDRLVEWIEFHLLVGFDHIYVYDNSGAHTNTTNLSPVLDLFPGQVTRIDWPSIVCNNNIPAHDSTGERSSQYAAENSCRTRYGPFTEWMASFDTDEYFVPMGKHESIADFLREAQRGGTNIVSLRSSRGRMRRDKSVATERGDALVKDPKATYLEAYNCDSAGSPKPVWADRARKQIYRADYVLYHYVHYSTVTQGILKTYEQAKQEGEPWHRKFGEKPPSERVTDELTEAVLLHTKTLGPDMTGGYKRRCRYDWEKKWQGCWVAFPWPDNKQSKESTHDKDGMDYNCFINERVDNHWVPKLREALVQRNVLVSSRR